jgi:hypothetical protein
MHQTTPTTTQFERADTRHVDAEHRPTDDEYQRYLGLVEFFRDQLHWDQTALATHSPIRVLDPLFTSTLARSCADLATLMDELKMSSEATQEREWLDQLRASIESRAGTDGLVRAREVNPDANATIDANDVADISCGSAMVLLIPELNSKLVEAARSLLDGGDLTTDIGVRSASINAEGYNRRGYWRGPVWTNITWLCAEGARTQGLDEIGARLDHSLLAFVDQVGMREYAAPSDLESPSATGLGADDFTWTAALLLHVLSYKHLKSKME